MRVEQFLEASAARLPDKVALVCEGQRVTYAELDTQATRFARALQDIGVGRGDRVVIHLDNSVAAVVSIFGTMKAGAVFVAVNPTMKPAKLAYILRDSGALVLVADSRRQGSVAEALAAAPSLKGLILAGAATPAPIAGAEIVLWLDAIVSAPSAPLTPPRGLNIDLAALVYTSGSTGVPKGVMLTHLNMTSAARSITTYLENTADDVIFNVLPLSFDYGLYQVLMAFRVGARVLLGRNFTYPLTVLELLRTERATGFPIVPTISALLVQIDLTQYRLPDLRYVTNTGAALPTPHITAIRAWLPQARLYSMYGLTECKRVAYLPPEEVDRRPLSVGRAMPNVEVTLVDEDGRPTTTGTGELVVRGSNVMSGYWNRPDETAQALRPGPFGQRVLYSGDIFRMDADGFLYFVSRKDDVIKSRGEKVSPREVENVLYDLPGVVEAAVIGEANDLLGNAVAAYIVQRVDAGLTGQDVSRHCARFLEDFMIPRRVEFIEAMPRTATGKIDRRALAGPRVDA
ncbi:MAG: AMP-binding protein [Vicinamibacteraceae bacterium]